MAEIQINNLHVWWLRKSQSWVLPSVAGLLTLSLHRVCTGGRAAAQSRWVWAVSPLLQHVLPAPTSLQDSPPARLVSGPFQKPTQGSPGLQEGNTLNGSRVKEGTLSCVCVCMRELESARPPRHAHAGGGS